MTTKTQKSETFKPVPKIRDMDKDTYTIIEKICRDCIESPKDMRFQDDHVISSLI